MRFAVEVLGFALTPRQSEILAEMAAEDVRIGILRCGRRSGKSRLAAILGVYESCVNASVHLSAVPASERLTVAILAASQKQARIIRDYVGGFLAVPELRPLVESESADEVRLRNGFTIAALPCWAGTARGLSTPLVIFDEFAHFAGRDGSPIDAGAVWAASTPGTATFPRGKVLALSTPRYAVGAFHELCEQAASGSFPDMRLWVESTATMRPDLAAHVERERSRDPELARAEYDGEFDAAAGSVFAEALVRAAVRDDVGDIPPLEGITYVITTDPAATNDRWSCLVGHVQADRVIVDRVTGWQGTRMAPLAIDATLDEIASLSRAYASAPVAIDQWSGQAIAQGLRKRGVEVRERPWRAETKLDAVTLTRQALYADQLSIPSHPRLVAEMLMLESRPLPSGRTRIAAPSGQHDDYVMALLGLVAELVDSAEPGWIAFFRERAAAPEQETPRSVLPDGSPVPPCGLRFRKPDGSIAVCAMPQMHPAGGHAEAPEQATAERTAGGTLLPDAAPCREQYRTETGGIDGCALPKGHGGRHGPGAALPVREAPGLNVASLFGGR